MTNEHSLQLTPIGCTGLCGFPYHTFYVNTNGHLMHDYSLILCPPSNVNTTYHKQLHSKLNPIDLKQGYDIVHLVFTLH